MIKYDTMYHWYVGPTLKLNLIRMLHNNFSVNKDLEVQRPYSTEPKIHVSRPFSVSNMLKSDYETWLQVVDLKTWDKFIYWAIPSSVGWNPRVPHTQHLFYC